jgi:hypothetical protein
MIWRPTVVVSNEFLLVPGNNPDANGGTAYTQNRVQIGVRLPTPAGFLDESRKLGPIRD